MLGVDVVEVERFGAALARSPGLEDRFFTAAERDHCAGSVLRLAGTFAAKEAVMKALGLTPAPAWARRIRIERDASGRPAATVEGGGSALVSISHDGPVAVAVALAAPERAGGGPKAPA